MKGFYKPFLKISLIFHIINIMTKRKRFNFFYFLLEHQRLFIYGSENLENYWGNLSKFIIEWLDLELNMISLVKVFIKLNILII